MTPDPASRAETVALDPRAVEIAARLQSLVGRQLTSIEVVPLGVMFHFTGGIVYWAYGGPR